MTGRWLPDFWKTAFLLAVARSIVASLAPIPDCDETFNYWEPAHMMVYGRGMQTWEYSPEFMFRSYAYVGLHGAVLGLFRMVPVHKPMMFFIIRGVLCFASALCDAVLVHGAAVRFGPGVGSFALTALLTGAGVLQASFAFLPSSFTMTLFSLCTGLWLGGNGAASVAAGAVGVLLGWPFAAVALVPVGLGLVYDALRPLIRRPSAWVAPMASLMGLVLSGLATSAVVLLVSLVVDVAYYGTVGLAVWEIIKYNALGMGGGGQGSDLYGVEPWWWYAANLALNFNVIAAVALTAPLAVLLMIAVSLLCERGERPRRGGEAGVWARLRAFSSNADPASALAVAAAFVGWFVLMSSRAHKEERFLFPVYPLLAVSFGISAEVGTQVAAGLLDSPDDTPRDAAEPDAADPKASRAAEEARLERAAVEADVTRLNRRPFLLAFVTLLALGASAAVSATRVSGQVIMYGASLGAWSAVAQLTQSRNPDGSPSASASAGIWTLLASERERLGGAASLMEASVTDADGNRARRYGEYSDEPFGLRVCVGKEWYRFPSAMFLPDSTRTHGSEAGEWMMRAADPAARSGGPLVLAYLRSGFGGQLPQHFDVLGNRTAAVLPGFNDMNGEEEDRYVPESACDVIVDLELPEGDSEPWIADANGAQRHWKSVWSQRFAHSDSTPQLARALWIPGWSESRVSWATYHVLRRLPHSTTKPLPTSPSDPSGELTTKLQEVVKDFQKAKGFEL